MFKNINNSTENDYKQIALKKKARLFFPLKKVLILKRVI